MFNVTCTCTCMTIIVSMDMYMIRVPCTCIMYVYYMYVRLETGCSGAPDNWQLTDCENQITASTGSISAK